MSIRGTVTAHITFWRRTGGGGRRRRRSEHLPARRRCDAVLFFFKQKTAYEIVSRDWSSDVCSSDLGAARALVCDQRVDRQALPDPLLVDGADAADRKSVGVGKECRSRWSPYH